MSNTYGDFIKKFFNTSAKLNEKYEKSEVTTLYALWLAAQDEREYGFFDTAFYEIMQNKCKGNIDEELSIHPSLKGNDVYN